MQIQNQGLPNRLAAASRYGGRRWQGLWAGVLGMIGVVSVWHAENETDVFWHLSQGREVLRQGSRLLQSHGMLDGLADRVVAPEWLWDVTVYVLHRIGGWQAQFVLVALLSFFCGVALVRLARAFAPDGADHVVVLLSGLAMVLCLARLRLRPQAAFLLILPLFVLLSHAITSVRAPAVRYKPAALLAALQLIWAQVHGSFILGPIIFAILASRFSWRHSQRQPRLLVLVAGLALLCACLTSAHGVGVFDYILAHAAGDAPRHIQDMQSSDWGMFNPFQKLYGPIYLLLVVLTLVGLPWLKRGPWAEAGLAILGLALGMTARRFFVAGGVLLLPLAARSVGSIALGARTRAWSTVVSIAAVLALAFSANARTVEQRGATFRTGFVAGQQPVAAAKYLAQASSQAGAAERVLTSFGAGPLLAFALDGRGVTFVDSRTPVVFDDTDLAVARDVFADEHAFKVALRRYDATAIVMDRNLPTCRAVPSDWTPVIIEPMYTTFVRRDRETGVESVLGCGREYLTTAQCSVSREIFVRDLARLQAVGDPDFAAFLAASRQVLCGEDLGIAVDGLPRPDQSSPYLLQQRRLLARHDISAGRYPQAITALQPLARAGDAGALDLLLGMLSKPGTPHDSLREALKSVAQELDDTTPLPLRTALAFLCAEHGDWECTRFHGLRAASKGDRRALQALRLLADKHPAERVRRDVDAWLTALSRTPENDAAKPGSPP
jgi:hypothetical protein